MTHPIVSRTVSTSLVLISLLSAAFGIWICFKYRIPVPFRDMVEVMAFLDSNPSVWCGDHFTQFQSMQHRPALAALVWHLDRLITGSSGFLPLVISYIALVTSSIITVTRWAPNPSLKRIETWVLPLAATALMLSLSNWINLVWEMQLHLSLSFLFIVASTYCGTNVWQANNARDNSFNQKSLNLAIVYGVCAAFSFGYGLVVLPVLLLHALLSGWPKKASLQIAIATLGLIVVYFFLLPREDSPAAHLNLQIPDITLLFAYISAILMGPLSGSQFHDLLRIDNVFLTSSACAIALLFYLTGSLKFYFTALLSSSKDAYIGKSFSVVITSCAVACALITTISRPVETQGFVDRYYIVGSLFLLALPGLFIRKQPQVPDALPELRVMKYIATFFLILAISGHLNNYERPLRKWHDATVGAVAADMKIYIEDGNELMGPALHQWRQTTFEIWENHAKRISAQREEPTPYSWVGKSLTKVFHITPPDHCTGRISRVTRVDDDIYTLFFLASAKPAIENYHHANWVVVADSNGVISGIGVPGYPTQLPNPQGTHKSIVWAENRLDSLTGFRGFLKVDIAQQLHFYVVRGRQACEFSTLESTEYTGRKI